MSTTIAAAARAIFRAHRTTRREKKVGPCGLGRAGRRPCMAVWFVMVVVVVHSAHTRTVWAEDSPQSKRTNLIAIVTDDQGRWAMGAYGNHEIRTPHMDRIAREGALMMQAFVVTPVCSPSRATYFTGRWPTELGITDWIAPMEADAGLGLDAPTWPEALQQAGYRTALIGKWHLGNRPAYHPTRRGFSHFMGFLGGGNRPMDPLLEVGGKTQRLKGPLPDLLTDEAIRFIRQDPQVPFALCLHFRAPHLPYGPVPEQDRKPYEGLDPTVPQLRGADVEQVKRWTRDYYASIHSVDRNIGRLLAVLDELALTERTLVIFTSDHGYNIGHHMIHTKGNGTWIAGGIGGPKRPNMWDLSIRIPMAVRWPGVIQPGTKIDHWITNLDVYRTVLGALGVPVPENAQPHGVDLSPVWRGESAPAREVLFGQYDLHNGGLAYMRMIRTPKYKFVRHYKTHFLDELYDLQADPQERRNLMRGRGAGEHRQVAEKLQRQLIEWQRSINDPLLDSGPY